MKLVGLNINIVRKDIVQNNVFDERSLIVLLVIKALDISERDRKNLSDLTSLFILAFSKSDAVVFASRN